MPSLAAARRGAAVPRPGEGRPYDPGVAWDDVEPRPPAPLSRRAAAGLIDCAILSVLFLLFVESAAGGDSSSSGEVLLSTLWFLMLHAYYFLPELFWEGRSLGKWALGLRVLAIDGREADPFAILIRTLLRLIDFVPALYLGGFIICRLTRRHQRLGDLAAGTMVVEWPRSDR
jgi:uncharacterized RDD family membrane protein YckC